MSNTKKDTQAKSVSANNTKAGSCQAFTRLRYENDTEWLAMRTRGIGGSDAAAIVGLNSFSSPLQVYLDKKGMIPPKEDSEAMRVGRDLEEYVAQRFCEATGLKVQRDNSILQSVERPWQLASIDRRVVGEEAGLECKTTNAFNKTDFEGGNVPAYYYVQCQHYMAVTGWKKWYLAVLVLGRGFYWFEVSRNEEDIAALIDAESSFWHNNVLANEMPAPIDTDGDVLKELYPNAVEGMVADLSDKAEGLKRLEELKIQIKLLDKEKKVIENNIKLAIGEAEYGDCEGWKIRYRSSERNSLDGKALKKDSPELWEKYSRTTTTRTLLINQEVR